MEGMGAFGAELGCGDMVSVGQRAK
jgi:hypothetical protein